MPISSEWKFFAFVVNLDVETVDVKFVARNRAISLPILSSGYLAFVIRHMPLFGLA